MNGKAMLAFLKTQWIAVLIIGVIALLALTQCLTAGASQ